MWYICLLLQRKCGPREFRAHKVNKCIKENSIWPTNEIATDILIVREDISGMSNKENNSNSFEFEINFFDVLVFLGKRKLVIIAVTAIFTILGIVFSLIQTEVYEGTAVIMPPADNSIGGSISASILKDLPIGKLGGLSASKNMENIYMAILKSRTLQLDVIQKFNLAKVYKFDKLKKFYIEDLIKVFNKHVNYDIADEGTMSITVEDEHPKQAAAMANYIAGKLNDIYKKLTIETAHNNRTFIESRLSIVRDSLALCEQQFLDFQKTNKVYKFDDQAKATIDAEATIEAKILSSQLELDLSKKIYPENNPQRNELEMTINALESQRKGLTDEHLSDILIPLGQAPELGLEFVRLKRNLAIQEKLFEFITQQYEEAKIEESKNTPTVQLLDPADIPQKRSKPHRTKIVFIAFGIGTIASFILLAIIEYFSYLKSQKTDDYRKLKLFWQNILH